ncbi:MAG: monofunctional biosynthetic peptidoglycan transglycosylase, partial [Candidatus Methylomirabilales bacterium]
MLALVGAVGLSIAPVLYLRFMPPPTSAFMLRKSIANLVSRQDAPIRYHWTGWTQISPSMRVAVVAAEDQKFPHHWGFDFESIAEAIEDQGPRRRVRGASTITQQVARNLFLWPGRSYVRKGLEAYFTVLLELLWPKRRILEVYLNIAEFGDGTYGVYAAAKTLFGKHPSELTPSEAALLAAVLPHPKHLHANTPSPYVEERARWIEEQMEQL